MHEKPIDLSDENRRKFQLWNAIAYALNALKPRLPFKEREIWSCHLGMNIGDEERGPGKEFLRPVVIIKSFNAHLCWIVPLTLNTKDSEYYFNFTFGTGPVSAAMLSQLQRIDAQRLHHRIGIMKKSDFREIKKRLATLLL